MVEVVSGSGFLRCALLQDASAPHRTEVFARLLHHLAINLLPMIGGGLVR